MADKTTNSLSVALTFTLQDSGGAQTSRTISFDTSLDPATAKQSFYNFKQDYLANYKYGIQPSGWRDSDVEDEAYECVNIGAKLISKTETEFEI